MKKAIFLLFLALGAVAQGAATSTNYVATVTFTNVIAGVTNGDTITVNGDTRIYTNGTLADAALWIQSTNIVGHAATNTWYHLGANAPTGIDIISANGTNAIDIRSAMDTALTVSLSSGVGTVAYVTNVFQPVRPLLLPLDGLLVASTRTNAQDRLIEALNLSYATGKVVSSAAPFTNFANLYNAQTLSNKTVHGLTSIVASISGLVDLTGNAGTLTNGTYRGATITNAAAISGVIAAISNGLWNAGILISPTTTNLVNYGNAISSKGSGSSSEQFGSSATASGSFSTAIGSSATASGNSSTAVGTSSEATSVNDVAIGTTAEAGFGNGIAIGTGADVNATNGIAIGNSATVSTFHSNSVAIGNSVTTTKTNQVLLGASTHLVEVPGRFLVSGTITNATHTGTQKFGVSGGPYAATMISKQDISSAAAGANTISFQSSYIRITGSAGAAFSIDGLTNNMAGNLDGMTLLIENVSGDSMTIAHQSGLEATAANRIDTTTGSSVTFGDDGVAYLVYDSGASRWKLVNPASAGPVLGEIYAYDNSTFSNYVTTASTYYQVTNIWNAGNASAVTVDASNSKITTQSSGYYKLGFDISFSGSASATFTFSVYTNGVEASNLEVERKLGTGGDIGSASRQGFAYLPTNCVVTLHLTADGDAKYALIKHGALLMHKVQ